MYLFRPVGVSHVAPVSCADDQQWYAISGNRTRVMEACLSPNARITAGTLIALLLPACAARPAAEAPTLAEALAFSIDSVVAAPPVHRAAWGILITEAGTGATLYARNADRLHIPASNTKIVVATVAMGRLGPDFRYATELRAAPAAGDAGARGLLVVGSGDPTWSARFYPSAAAPFDSLAAMAAAAGIRSVPELVVDVSRFRDEPVHPTWEVSDLPGVFAPPVDAFAAADGTFRLAVTAGPAVGAPGRAESVPPFHQPVRATVLTDTAGAPRMVTTDFKARRDTIYLTARIGLGASDTVTLAVTRPAETAAAALAEALRGRGIAVGTIRLVRDSAEAAVLRATTAAVGTLRSAPMRDIVATIMRPSQNWVSEQVLKTLGAELAGEGSWNAGLSVERAYLYDVVGVDTGTFFLRDASGMSAQNLLTPAATIAMLDHARRQPWGDAYRVAFPQPGMAGSTLAARLRPLDGRVFAKTGTITNVNALSGYFVATDGREYLFSILTSASGQPAATMRNAIDDVVLVMARHLDGRAHAAAAAGTR
jgi:serine-type D-Ala-D-Ala carboxypeptidase/endopeptidase (penicillin-binding protein 4)